MTPKKIQPQKKMLSSRKFISCLRISKPSVKVLDCRIQAEVGAALEETSVKKRG